tara:strand:+ start:673 stop:828 length:156 start_codon:yes stop_codon:yes gene_type:complete
MVTRGISASAQAIIKGSSGRPFASIVTPLMGYFLNVLMASLMPLSLFSTVK